MKKRAIVFLIVLFTTAILSWTIVEDQWIIEKQKGYSVFYTTPDKNNLDAYQVYFEKGKKTVEDFFQSPFEDDFSIYIHPSRTSLDSTWQKDWNMPDFKSQCWMVASGVSHKLDIISPKKWDSLACEHTYADSIKTQDLITHELVHVYHGQQNESPDFSDVSGIDWFIEGLAVYASGQCDTKRIAEVKKAISKNNTPQDLSDFWSGKLRYGLSGTVVMYIDKKYGRQRLVELLEYNNILDVLNSLATTESEILIGWEKYMNR